MADDVDEEEHPTDDGEDDPGDPQDVDSEDPTEDSQDTPEDQHEVQGARLWAAPVGSPLGPHKHIDTVGCIPPIRAQYVQRWGVAKTQLPRTGVSQASADSDTWPGRTGFNAEYANLNNVIAVWGQGTTAARPVAAYQGRWFWATDTSRLWVDNGTAWTEVSPVGGGGVPVQVNVGSGGSEGVSRIAARADHSHPLAAPAFDPGSMSFGSTADRGSSGTVARANHVHRMDSLPYGAAPPVITRNSTSSAGVSTDLSRADHNHGLVAWGGAYSGATTVAFDQTFRPIPMTAAIAGSLIGPSGLSGTSVYVPVNGIYMGTIHAVFEASSTGHRSLGIGVNGAVEQLAPVVAALNGINTTVQITFQRHLAAGDFLNPRVWQTSGTILLVTTEMLLHLVAEG